MQILKTIQMKCGQAYVVSLEDQNYLLELGDVFLPNEEVKGTRPYRYQDFGDVSDANKRVMTICTMVGCPGSCSFCSVRNTFKRRLTCEEIVSQVDFLVEQGLNFDRSPSPLESRDFHVLYTRMGEPALNIDNVIHSIYDLTARYPHVQIGMSTAGWRKGARKFLKHPEIGGRIMMQFSLHATDQETRSRFFGLSADKNLMSIEEIGGFVKEFIKFKPQRAVSLNFILFKGVKYDFRLLREHFSPEDVYIRLSPLNVTENSEQVGLRGLLKEEDVLYKTPLSSPELKAVLENLEESGFSYAYAPAIDEEIQNQAACGQALETLKENGLSTFSGQVVAEAPQSFTEDSMQLQA